MFSAKPLHLVVALLASNTVIAANDLFFSEYVEGSSNNKALEIYNNTGATVNLSGYEIQMYFNGATTPGLTVALTGTIAQGGTFVFAHSSAMTSILEKAQQLSGAGMFNGDDAVALLHGGVPIDVIGQIGVDPGAEWGAGMQSTADNTLRRKSTIDAGRSDGYSVFTPSLEWDGFDVNTVVGLGTHNGSTGGDNNGGNSSLGSCGNSANRIHNVQGTTDTSPLLGQTVVIEGVVTANFQSNNSLAGFYVQEEDSDADADTHTSEGIFVYNTSYPVAVGNRVRIAGAVSETFGQTQLGAVTGLLNCGAAALPTATSLTLPWASTTAAEAFEGMWVALPQSLTVSENYNLARFGEVTLSNNRLMIPTQIALPGSAANAVAEANLLNQLLLDDNSNVQNPDPVIYPIGNLSASNSLRAGSRVSNLTGVLGYGFSAYRLFPTSVPVFSDTNVRPAGTELPPVNQVRIASFNVLNYFNGDGMGGGFPASRGANTQQEFERQRSKTIAALHSLNADVIGLMEMENDGFGANSAIQDLVAGLGPDWRFVNPGLSAIGTDEITVGILYRQSRVTPVGAAVTTSAGAFADRNRQPLLQTFRPANSGDAFTVVVNHFKSKGSCPTGSSADQNQGDGQGCWNATRVAAATSLAAWVNSNPSGYVDGDVVIIGDLNAYAKEDPVRYLVSQGYVNLIEQRLGNQGAYSFVFSAESGYLDHALATVNFAAKVQQVEEHHINADEPRALDYNVEFKSSGQLTSFYNADAYRSSDHDPLLLDFLPVELPGDLDRDGDVDNNDATLLRQRLNTTATGADDPYDLNQDGRINISDLRRLTQLCTRSACVVG